MAVTRFACSAVRFASLSSDTTKASVASWIAATADAWKRGPLLWVSAISRTSRENGALAMSSSVLFCRRRTSRSATVPGRQRNERFMPVAPDADFLAFFCPSARFELFDFTAVCLVWVAIVYVSRGICGCMLDATLHHKDHLAPTAVQPRASSLRRTSPPRLRPGAQKKRV